VSDTPHAAPEPEAPLLLREGPFVLPSVIGLTYFIASLASGGFMDRTTDSVAPLLEELAARVIEDPSSFLVHLIALGSFRLVPPLAGAVLLLYLSTQRRPLLPALKAHPTPWNLWDFFKIWASSLCLLPIAQLVMQITPSIWDRFPKPTTFGLLASGQNVVTILLCACVVRLRGRQTPLSARNSGRTARKSLAYGVRGFLIAAPFVFGAEWVSGKVFDLIDLERVYHPALSYLLEIPPSQIWILLAAAVVFAPLGEELLFRGFLYPSLERRIGRAGGMIVTGFLFAALHLNPFDFLPLFVLGIVLSYTYSRTRLVSACVVLHATHNAISAGAALTIRFMLR